MEVETSLVCPHDALSGGGDCGQENEIHFDGGKHPPRGGMFQQMRRFHKNRLFYTKSSYKIFEEYFGKN